MYDPTGPWAWLNGMADLPKTPEEVKEDQEVNLNKLLYSGGCLLVVIAIAVLSVIGTITVVKWIF